MARTRRVEREEREVRVTEVPVEGAREFITFGPDSPVWGSTWVWGNTWVSAAIPSGCFVRVEPPQTATSEEVAKVVEWATKCGALRVSVLPRRRAAAVLAPREKRPHRRAREVVAELVAEANVSEEDRAALRTFAEEVMSRRNL